MSFHPNSSTLSGSCRANQSCPIGVRWEDISFLHTVPFGVQNLWSLHVTRVFAHEEFTGCEGVKAHWNGVSADGTLAAGTCQAQPPPTASRLHSYCLSSRKLPHCELFWQADSVNKAASITFTVVEKSSDHSEVAEGCANSASGRHISSIADLWTGRNYSWFKPWGSSASWEIQHHNVSIPGVSELLHARLWVLRLQLVFV